MIRKGLWSPEEDDKLRWCISMYVNGSWNDIARKAGLQRCGRSCRQRWLNHLRPGLKKGKFSNEELRKVLNLHSKLGNRWSQIAGHLEGRTDNEVKNLWNTVIKRRLILPGIISACKSGDYPTHLGLIKQQRRPLDHTSDIVNANDDLGSIKRDAISLISLGEAQYSPSHSQSVSSSLSSSSCNPMDNPNPSSEVDFSSSTLRDGQCCDLMENPNPSSDVQDFTSTTLIRDGQCCTNLIENPNPSSGVDFSSTLRDGQCLIDELMLNSGFTMIEGRNSYGHEAHSSTAPTCMEEELDYASNPVPVLSPNVYKINQPIATYDQPLIPPLNIDQDWYSVAKLLAVKSADIKEALDGSMDGGQLSSCFIPNQHMMTIYGHSLPLPSDGYISNCINDNLFLHSIDAHHHDLTAILPHHLPHYQNEYSMHGILANSGVE